MSIFRRRPPPLPPPIARTTPEQLARIRLEAANVARGLRAVRPHPVLGPWQIQTWNEVARRAARNHLDNAMLFYNGGRITHEDQ